MFSHLLRQQRDSAQARPPPIRPNRHAGRPSARKAEVERLHRSQLTQPLHHGRKALRELGSPPRPEREHRHPRLCLGRLRPHAAVLVGEEPELPKEVAALQRRRPAAAVRQLDGSLREEVHLGRLVPAAVDLVAGVEVGGLQHGDEVAHALVPVGLQQGHKVPQPRPEVAKELGVQRPRKLGENSGLAVRKRGSAPAAGTRTVETQILTQTRANSNNMRC